MFQTKDLSSLDYNYFDVINPGCFNVIIQSRNTNHYWSILHEEFPTFQHCIIYHKHKANSQYHYHGHASNLKKALEQIKSHDAFQLNGRKKVIN